MTQFLPPNLLALFAARDPVPYLPPVIKLTHEKKRIPYSGVADYLDYFEDPEETPPPVHIETKQERKDRKKREKAEQLEYKLEQDLALWNPNSNENATSDPYKTLFVGRINYDTSESKLKREFEAYGKVKQIKMVYDVDGKSRGYAFIEYEDESSMHAAYKRADGKKIDGKRVVVDIERGRTIDGWKPRRLGGGKGGTKRKPIVNEEIEADKDELMNTSTNHQPPSVDVINRKERSDRDSRGGGGGGVVERRSSRERKRSKERRSRSRSRDRKRRSRSKDRHRSKSRERKEKKSRRSRSRDRSNKKARSRSTEK